MWLSASPILSTPAYQKDRGPVRRRGLVAFPCAPGRRGVQGDLSAGDLKTSRRQARRFARMGACSPPGDYDFFAAVQRTPVEMLQCSIYLQ